MSSTCSRKGGPTHDCATLQAATGIVFGLGKFGLAEFVSSRTRLFRPTYVLLRYFRFRAPTRSGVVTIVGEWGFPKAPVFLDSQ